MQLLYTNCVPIVTYGSQVKVFNARDTRRLSVALNDAIRKIFDYNRWQSVSELRQLMFYKTFEELFDISKRRFKLSLNQSPNIVIRTLSNFD